MPSPSLMWGSLTIPPAASLNSTASRASQRQIEVAGARSIVPLVYGEDRIGARILNVIKAADNTDVLVQALWCFAGDSVNDPQLNDLALPSGATITHYTGTQTTANSLLVAAFAAQSITYADALTGYMYSVLRLPSSAFTGQLKLTARIKGRKLYDQRKDSTAGGSGSHRLATPSTWEWSDCPALALGDFLYSSVYGAGETVNWSSVGTVATANDATVGSPAQKRRLLGIAFISQASVADMAETLRAYAGCFLLPEDAGIKLVADADAATAATYAHASGQIARMDPLTLRDLGSSPTAVEVFFTNTTDEPWFDDSAIAELPGAGSTLPYRLSQVRLPGIQRYSQAYREAVERLNKLTLQDLSTSIEVFDIGIRHQMADIVEVTHPVGVTSKKFRLTGLDMLSAGRWRLQLLEHDPASYSTSVVTQPTYSNSGLVISDGTGGGDGASQYMIQIYRASATTPPTPSGGTYTFSTDMLVPPQTTGPDAMWSDVLLRLDTQGTTGATSLTDQGPASIGSISFSSGASITTTRGKWSSKSLRITEASPPSSGVSSTLLNRVNGTAMTLETWFYGVTIPNRDPSVCLFEWRSPSNALVLRIYYYANLGRIYVNNGGTTTDLGLISLSAWHWLQAVVGTDNQLRIRIDDVPLYTGAFGNANATGSYTLRVGAINGTAADACDVSLDDIRVTKNARAFAVPTARLPISGTEPWGDRTIPAATGIPRWVTQQLASTTTPSTAVTLGAWSAPKLYVKDGDATVALKLSSETVAVASDSAGSVASFGAAFTDVSVEAGGTTVTSAWTIAKTDGSGITSTLSSGRVQITAMSADGAFVTVTATPVSGGAFDGYPVQTKRFVVTKARSAGGTSTGVNGTYFFSIVPSNGSTSVTASVRFDFAGRVYARNSVGVEELVGAWYTPPGLSIGSGLWIKVTARSGASTLTAGSTGAPVNLATGETWSYTVAVGGAVKSGVFDYVLYADSGGSPDTSNTVGSGVFELSAGA